ncbi:YbgC/FadM family acyl-CoA thioesterase [Ottowia sp. VDI28]|uniref:YbgC/FadM family acyl-CoA thioesterase n=1 Tax=Ottowia sp. VDI28 TaxID=3133968 RepID=UPI003C2ECCF0
MNRQDFRFFEPLRVRWSEVDLQKIVFNAHYLTYFDIAITGYWRALAMPYAKAMEQLEGDLYMRKAGVEFHASARWDDRLEVGMRCARIGNSSITMAGAIFRGDQLLITSELVYVFADPNTQTSRPVPAPLRDMLQGFEAGEAMLDVRTGDWAALGEAAASVRTEVFVEEQGIAQEDEWDEADATAVHALVRNRLGQPVGTGRLLQDSAGVARIGRMAALHPLRGAGIGQAVMAALEQAARDRGDTQVVLSAQRSAEDFYRRLGYAPNGEPYEEVGIAHIPMARSLVV